MTLRVTLEIVPFGDEDKKYKICQLDIFDMGHIEGTANDRYGVIQIDPEMNTGGLYEQTVFHERRKGAWRLVKQVLSDLVIYHEPR